MSNDKECGCLNCSFYRVIGQGGLEAAMATAELLTDDTGSYVIEFTMKMSDDGVRLSVHIPSNADGEVIYGDLNAAMAMSEVLPNLLEKLVEQPEDYNE